MVATSAGVALSKKGSWWSIPIRTDRLPRANSRTAPTQKSWEKSPRFSDASTLFLGCEHSPRRASPGVDIARRWQWVLEANIAFTLSVRDAPLSLGARDVCARAISSANRNSLVWNHASGDARVTDTRRSDRPTGGSNV